MLDKLIKLSLQNRLLVVAIAALLVGWGAFALKDMPIDVFPDLNRPTVTIMSESHGLAPEEVETLVTTPIENAMSGLPGVIRVRSSSSIGLSIVWVEFEFGTDLLINRQLVNEKLTIVRSTIPEEISPQMGPISSLMGEIMLLGLTDDEAKPWDTRLIADWTLRPRLQAISGVANVVAIGGGVKQVRIAVDPIKLRHYGVTYDEVAEAARGIGSNSTGGFVEGQHNEFLIRHIARPQDLDQIKQSVVSMRHGTPIRLMHIADVRYSKKVMRGDAGIGGKPGVIMGIQKQPGTNTVTLTQEVQKTLEELAPALPKTLKVTELFKQSTFIETAVHNVVEALRDGSIFVAIVLFLFLLNMRTTLITLTAIPLSLLITFAVMKIFGITINTMTLGGLAIAIGELVDDAIVDVENVFRRLRENRQSKEPSNPLYVVFTASSEIRNSIVIATAIVIMVFIPLLALEGLEGRFFVSLGIAYMVSILASLLVSLTVTPALCSYLLPNAKATAERKEGRLIRILKAIDLAVLARVLDRPKTVIALCGTLVSTAILAVTLMGSEFLPSFNEGTVTAFVVTPPGTSLKESNRIGTVAETLLLSIPEIKVTGRRTGRAEQDEHAEGVYNSEIDVELHPSSRSREEVLNHIRKVLGEIPGIAMSLGQPIAHRLDHMMSGVQAQIAIKIFGDDLRRLREIAEAVKSAAEVVAGATDVSIERMTMVPQIQVIPDRDRLSALGLTPSHVSEKLEHILSGENVGEIIKGQTRTSINLRINDTSRHDVTALQNLVIDGAPGQKFRLGDLAQVQKTHGPNAINHENSKRRIIVSANTTGRDLGSVVKDIQREVRDHVKLPNGYFVTYGGQFESQMSATRSIATLSIVSFLGVFLILHMYFGSAFLSAQVMLNIPLALIGAVAAIFLTGGVFSVGTLVGFITLCGIASRNGILLLSHYLYLMEEEGMKFGRELVVKGSQERLVPMLMTALTAVLALLPLALAKDTPGKEILHPVAVVILGGLLTSTLLDMVVTPTLFLRYGRASAKKALEKRSSSALKNNAKKNSNKPRSQGGSHEI